MSAALLRLVVAVTNLAIATKGSAPPNPPAKAEERKGYESDKATKDVLSEVIWWYRPVGMVCSHSSLSNSQSTDEPSLFDFEDNAIHPTPDRDLRPSLVLLPQPLVPNV